MKSRAFFLLLLVCPLVVCAQILYSPGGDHYERMSKETYDTACICVFYDLRFLKDSTKTTDYTECQTVLLISDKYTSFGDYNRILLDSVNDYLAESKKNAKDKIAREQWDSFISKWKYNIVTMNDLAAGKSKIQIYDILRSYEYTFDTPDMEWTLVEGDTIINQMPCRKATGSYAGRQYVAWYAESLPLPYGPYVFGGLPGLILQLHDTKYNWIFTNTRVGKAVEHKDMYLYRNKFVEPIIHTTRREALEAYRNDIENFDNLSIDVFKVKVMQNGRWVSPEANRLKRPSNLLELVW